MKKFLIAFLCIACVSALAVGGLQLFAGIDLFNFGSGDDTTPHEHAYGEWTVTEAATCTDDGVKERACECGEKETEAIEAAGHNFVTYTSDENATCTEDGTKTAKCERCDKTDTVTEAETKLGHNFVTYISDENATCTEDGTKTAKCERCDETNTVTEAETKFGHSYTSVVTDPTCTADGYTTYTCGNCSDSYTSNITAANGHSKTNPVVTEPTCTTGGYTTYTCDVCSESFVDDKTEPVHIYTKWTIKESGDTTDTYEKSCDCGARTEIMTAVPKASIGLDMEYSEELGGYVVTGIGTCTDTDLVIPATYNGKPVVAIAGAETWGTSFYGADISSLTIIGGVKKIGECAFAMTMDCFTLVLSDSVREISDQAFTLMGVNRGGPTIHYLGTEEQWQELEMSNQFMYNGTIFISSIDYNYDFSE